LGFSSLIYHFSPEEIANLNSFRTDTESDGGDPAAGRITGKCVPGDIYWNTAWNTFGGDGDIVAMP
jgi:hypothetical protein